jgi:putative addiction module killer protein
MVTSVDMTHSIPYNPAMKIEVRVTREFDQWLDGLRDKMAKEIIAERIFRASLGNLGNGNLGRVKPLGGGLSEFKIEYGPGYRLYFGQRGEVLIILLCGGDKSKQARDIARARKLLKGLDE